MRGTGIFNGCAAREPRNPAPGLAFRGVFSDFLHDETGATIIEYALLAGAISIAAVLLLVKIGFTVDDMFLAVATAYPS